MTTTETKKDVCFELFEAACEKLGVAPVLPDVSKLEQKDQRHTQVSHMLKKCIEAKNDGWQHKRGEWGYFPVFEVVKDERQASGFGLSDSLCGYEASYSVVGSRLTFQTEEKAEEAAVEFAPLYTEYLLIQE